MGKEIKENDTELNCMFTTKVISASLERTQFIRGGIWNAQKNCCISSSRKKLPDLTIYSTLQQFSHDSVIKINFF